MHIPIEEKTISIDENGLLVTYKGRYFRVFTAEQQKSFVEPLMRCGLIPELVGKNLLVPTWITDYNADGYALILEHQALTPLVYPYEWSFSMMKDAALAYLKIVEISLSHGYYLKDCHPFNFVFYGGKPLWVDFCSFEKCNREFSGFFATTEFIKQYYYPLRLWSQVNEFFGRAVHGIMSSYHYLDFADYLKICHFWARWLPIRCVEKIGRLMEMYYNLWGIDEHGIGLRKKSNWITMVAKATKKTLVPPTAKQFRKWHQRIVSLPAPSKHSQWQDYHVGLMNRQTTPRFSQIAEIIRELGCDSVTELAGNAGAFSLLLYEKQVCKHIICTDYNEKAIDRLYSQIKQQQYDGISAAVINMMFPIITTFGKEPQERLKSEAVVALAVTHHLVLSQKFKLRDIFNVIAGYSSRYVLIEFMPLGLHDGINTTPIPDWYNIDWFRSEFGKQFKLIQECKLESNRILFIGELHEN